MTCTTKVTIAVKSKEKLSSECEVKRGTDDIQRPRQQAVEIRHPKEGRFNSHRVLPPTLRPAHYRSSGPHSTVLLGSHSEGDFRRSVLGEYSKRRTLEWKLRITEIFHRLRRGASG